MTNSAKSDSPNDLAKLRQSLQAESHWQNAQRFLLNGRYSAALASYRNLVQHFPGVSQLWAELGIAAAGDLDFALANQASQRAAELADSDASLLVSIGQQYHRLRRPEQTRACFERAVTADPSSVHARLTLAAWMERNHRLEEAWQSVNACLEQHPKEARALHFKAFLLHRQGKNSEAETVLRDLLKSGSLDPDVQYSATHLLGVILDALGQYPEALQCLDQAKTLLRQISATSAPEKAYDQMDRARRKLLEELTPDTMRRWREEAGNSPLPLAFLGGPPRSGTTLIEQILGAHSDILVFDESEALPQELLNLVQPPPPARSLTLKTLNSLPAAGRAHLVNRYLKSLMREVEENPNGKLLLDKNPFMTSSLHIWLRFFTQSKIIIALRDPRDVVISCYFQNIPVNPASVNFLSLQRTVKYYSDCMDVWLRLREIGGFDWLETRYEDVVTKLESEGPRITSFLGLPWQEGQSKFHETAKRKFLTALPYDEVTRPATGKSIGRWKNYAEALAPLESSLAKYCQTFGYGAK